MAAHPYPSELDDGVIRLNGIAGAFLRVSVHTKTCCSPWVQQVFSCSVREAGYTPQG